MRYQKLNLDIIVKQFKYYVRNKQNFRNHNLTSEHIADELGVSRTILSRAVNQKLGMSIKDYINELRLKYVTKLMEKNSRGLTIEQITFLAGFSFPSTYYRLIKK